MQPTDFLPRCVLGTAGLGGVWGKVDKEESVKTILIALENGVTDIDMAPAYGDAEEFVSNALRQWNGVIPGLSTKVGRLKTYRADQAVYDYSNDRMEQSVVESLRKLDVPEIDILFLHDPLAIPADDVERVLEQLLKFKEKGYAKKLGIGGNGYELFSNYDVGEIFDVAMEFNHMNAVCWDALDTSFHFYQSHGIDYYAASPLHMGLLGNKFETYTLSPPPWLQKQSIEKAKRVKMIAGNHDLALSSLAHRFLLSIRENFKIVIGATDTQELYKTLFDLSQGPLQDNIFNEIMNVGKTIK